MEDIYKQIKDVASYNGVPMHELASRMNISRQSLNNSMKSPSYPTLVRIAQALDIPLWQLFIKPGEEKPLTCPHCGESLI